MRLQSGLNKVRSIGLTVVAALLTAAVAQRLTHPVSPIPSEWPRVYVSSTCAASDQAMDGVSGFFGRHDLSMEKFLFDLVVEAFYHAIVVAVSLSRRAIASNS